VRTVITLPVERARTDDDGPVVLQAHPLDVLTFTRATTAGAVGRSLQVEQAAANVLRGSDLAPHHVYDPVTGALTRAVLLEGARSNLVPNTNGRMNSLTPGGTTPPTVVPDNVATPCGPAAWWVVWPNPLTTNYAGCRVTGPSFATTAVAHSGAIWIHGPTTGLYIYVTGSFAWPPAVVGRTVEYGGLLWREFRTTNHVAAAGTYFWTIFASSTAPQGTQILVAAAQAEVGPTNSSLILGATAPVARAADNASYAIPASMQPPGIIEAGGAAWYVRFIESGTAHGSTAIMWLCGGGTAYVQTYYVAGATRYSAYMANSGTDASLHLPNGSRPALGDLTELLLILSHDGAMNLVQRVNGTMFTTASSAAVPLPNAWGGSNLHLNGLAGASAGQVALLPSGIADANGQRQLLTYIPGLPAMGLTATQAMDYAAGLHARVSA
jgi:hypothetical protein